jgi:hypothetical protein
MKYLAAVAAAALLTGVVAAQAQGTGMTSGSSANQCWDVSTNSIKNQAPSGSAAGGSTVGSAQSGSAGTAAGSAGGGSASGTTSSGMSGSGSSGTAATTRPTGMRDC